MGAIIFNLLTRMIIRILYWLGFDGYYSKNGEELIMEAKKK